MSVEILILKLGKRVAVSTPQLNWFVISVGLRLKVTGHFNT